jgi:hypothetical protein
LQFSLRDQGSAGRDGSNEQQRTARVVVADPELSPAETRQAGYGRLLRSGGGVDIRI